jgi:putative addiction module component (TIGR02574 family)
VTHEEIAAAALKLPHKQRAELASELLRSLDELSGAEIEQLWAEEVDRRIRAMREGRAKGIPGEEVFARGRALLSS